LNHLSDRIIELLIKQWKGKATAADLLQIWHWLNENAENKRTYDELNDIWLATANHDQIKFDAFNALQTVKFLIGEENKPFITTQKAKISHASVIKTVFKYVAVFVFAFMLGVISFNFIFQKKAVNDNQITEITAPMGSKSQVTLPDGTKVWLNSGSKLSYNSQFNQKTREVSLEGEAFFDVTKRKGMQFLVKTKDITIRVLGTAFNVKAYPVEGSIETTLVRGSLILEHEAVKNMIQTMLKPDQRAAYFKHEGIIYLSETEKQSLKKENIRKIEEVKGQVVLSKKVDTDIFTAWKDNKLIFRNESFESLVVKLERWYGVQIILADDDIRNYHFNGTIENETVQDVLEIIKFTLPIQYTIQHNIITLQQSNPKK